jgi:CRISPR-associated protein Cmr2
MNQDTYIAAIALGPVGAFIAGGRRSRDLWFGSRFLSEATRWAAHTLGLHDEIRLIIPRPERIRDSFLDDPEGRGLDRGPTISNKILCRITAPEAQVRALLIEAQRQAHRFLAGEVRKYRERLSTISDPEQIDRQAQAIEDGDFVECYAAWARIADPSDAAEEAAIERASRLLDGRKAARLFTVPESEAGKPKCSLEAGWDSVLIEHDPARTRQAAHLFLGRQRLGIRPDERLSAVGLARRLAALSYTTEGRIGLPKLPFPPLAQVAADAWLQAAKDEQHGLPHVLAHIHQRFRRLLDSATSREERELCFVLASPSRRPGSRGDVEPVFDASIYFEGFIEARRREIATWRDRFSIPRADVEKHLALLDDIEGPVRRLQEKLGLPLPYFALLEADGDGLGDAIAHARGNERVRLIEALYRFSDRAWEFIDEHYGCAFYVGGDELAAYLPLDRALSAARKLTWLYDEIVQSRAPGTSLSCGLVVAHIHDDLRATRDRASRALKAAKGRRREQHGHIMIYDEPRAGARRPCGGPTLSTIDRIESCIALLEDQAISLSSAHAIRDLYETVGRSGAGLSMGKAILTQKRRRSGMETEGQAEVEGLLSGIRSWDDLLDLSAALLLAARIIPVQRLRRLGEVGGGA